MKAWTVVLGCVLLVACEDEPCECSNAPGETAVVSLECVCNLQDCPAFDAIARVGDCQTMGRGSLTSGCGNLRVKYSVGDLMSRTWVFDADTHELIDSGFHDDTPQGPCEAGRYMTPGLDSACAEETTCSLCEGDPDVCELP